MIDGIPVVKCGNLQCTVAETGRCLEGMKTDKCPNFGNDHVPINLDSSANEQIPRFQDGVQLPDAETKAVASTAELLQRYPSRVVAIIGSFDAGKSSLIASVYDLFQVGEVAGVRFARSTTLHAFERICHDTRSASRRHAPHINRTPIGEVNFYHLDVSFGDTGELLALVLGDRAGEQYLMVANDVSTVKDLSEIRRCDTLTVLVDGERLEDVGARHNLQSEITMILQALVDGGSVSNHQQLAIVLTKIDCIETSLNRERAYDDFAKFVAKLGKRFDPMFGKVESFKIAASPKLGATPRGAGVAELFSFWLGGSKVNQSTVVTMHPSERAFSRLQPMLESELPNG